MLLLPSCDGRHLRSSSATRFHVFAPHSRRICRSQQQQQQVLRSVQRGMLRHVFLVVDASRAMEATDLKPSRAAVTLSLAKVRRARPPPPAASSANHERAPNATAVGAPT
jgi:hypothetical protein